MKKSITFLIILVLMMTILSCSVLFAEESDSSQPQKTELDTIVMSDMATYMKLSNPIALDKTSGYLVAANNKTLFVQPQRDKQKSYNLDLLSDQEQASGAKIEKLMVLDDKVDDKIVGGKIVALVVEGDHSTLKIVNAESKVITTPTDEIFKSINTITKNGSHLGVLMANNNQLHSYDITEDGKMQECDIPPIQLETGRNFAQNFKIIGTFGYFTTASDGKTTIKKYDFSTKQLTDMPTISTLIVDYHIVGNTIHYIDQDFNLHIGDKIVQANNLSFKQLISFNDEIIATAETKDTIDNGKIYFFDNNGKETNQIASKGNDLYRFDTPQGMFSDGNYIYIADTNNRRIIKRNVKNDIRNEYKTANNYPSKVVAVNEKIYYISNGELFDENNKKILYQEQAIYAKSIAAYGDKLLILSDTVVYTFDGEEVNELIKNIATADVITTAYQTNYAYLINKSEGKIVKYNLENLKSYSLEAEGVAGCDNYNVDFRGNLFVQKGDIISKYTQNNKMFTLEKQFNLKGVTKGDKIAVAIDSINAIYYFVHTNDHLLFQVENNTALGIMGTKNLTVAPPEKFDIIEAGLINNDSYTYITPDNPESARQVKKGERFLILAQCDKIYNGKEYYYVISSNLAFAEYLCADDIDKVERVEMKNQIMTATVDSVEVYKYPYKSSELLATSSGEKIILSPDTEVTCLHKVAGQDKETNEEIWNWYAIKLTIAGEAITGYVGCNYLAKVVPTTPPKNIVFMRTKSPKIGTNIKIYAEADINSEVLFDNVSDGIDIQVVGEYKSNTTFTKVFYEGSIGYILNENLQPAGLTPNQIIAITITSVAIVIFAVIGLLFMHKNKNSKKKVEKESKDIM